MRWGALLSIAYNFFTKMTHLNSPLHDVSVNKFAVISSGRRSGTRFRNPGNTAGPFVIQIDRKGTHMEYLIGSVAVGTLIVSRHIIHSRMFPRTEKIETKGK
jgi:hypothetical protein